jgi:integrase
MPITHRLTLFRRHSSKCTEKYPKDKRITESDSMRATKLRQCNCTIVAQGTLPNGKFLKHPSTGENVWSEAHKVAALWWQWGDTTPPADVVREIEEQEQGTRPATKVTDAAEKFINKKKDENVSEDIIKAHKRLLLGRLVPFTTAKGLPFIEQLDNAEFWSDFRNSWKNLNPTHNRKVEGQIPDEPVAPGTAKRLLTETREFIRFCISRKWLTEEWAAKRFLKVSTRVEPKEPFTDEDVEAIFAATSKITDGHRRTGQQNARELLVFVYVLRYSGLRISDVVTLEAAALVPRPGDPGNYSLHVYMKKTKKWVFIPIPSGDLPGYPDVAKALRSLPIKQGKYFFLGGKGTLKANKTSWQTRLKTLFAAVDQPLSVHPHPHRFRHTFAARLLEMGMDVRDVAELLGDSLAVVLKHYAKYTTKQQALAVDKWKVAMGQARKAKFQVVAGGRA